MSSTVDNIDIVPSTSNMSLKSPPRIHYCVHYQGTLVSFEDMVKLGDSYQMLQPPEEGAVPLDDVPKYKPGQSASWSDLSAEIRNIIYDYVYKGRTFTVYNYHMTVNTGRYWRSENTKMVEKLTFDDGDILVQVPHYLADRFVSRQWLLETTAQSVDSKYWHLHCQDVMWKFVLQTFAQPDANIQTLADVAHSVVCILFYNIRWMGLSLEQSNVFTDFFDMKDFAPCKNLQYIQMAHDKWWDKQFWIRPDSSTSPEGLEIVTLGQGEGKTDHATIRKNVHTISREHANTMISQYKSSLYEEHALMQDDMRTAVYRWADQIEAFQNFKAMFKEWPGPDPMYPSEFAMRSSVPIQEEPKRAVCFEMRIETCKRFLLKCWEVDNVLYEEGDDVAPVTEQVTENTEQPVEPAVAEAAEIAAVPPLPQDAAAQPVEEPTPLQDVVVPTTEEPAPMQGVVEQAVEVSTPMQDAVEQVTEVPSVNDTAMVDIVDQLAQSAELLQPVAETPAQPADTSVMDDNATASQTVAVPA